MRCMCVRVACTREPYVVVGENSLANTHTDICTAPEFVSLMTQGRLCTDP